MSAAEITVAEMDTVGEDVMAAVELALKGGFGVSVLRHAPLGDPGFAVDVQRRQYSAPLILKMLLAVAGGANHAPKLLAVTGRDLFIPMLSFVYGQAQLDGRVAVVSIARLRSEFYGLEADPGLLAARVRKEALHEVGHLFGLLHCADRACAMALATNIHQLDLKQPELCGGCVSLARERRGAMESSSRERERV